MRAGSGRRLSRGFRSGIALAAIPCGTILAVLAAVITIEDVWLQVTRELFLEEAFGVALLIPVIGLALAAHSWLDAPPPRAALAGPLDFLRQDRLASLVGAGTTGVVVGLLGLPAALAGSVVGSLVSAVLSGWSGYPGQHSVGAVVRARADDLTTRPFGGMTLAVVATMVLPAVAVAVLMLLTRAWPRFALVRIPSLGRRARGPWDILDFLADARDRGLIRQAAGSYQFRHSRLQERLANQVLDPADEGRTAPASLARRRAGWAVAAAAVLLAGGALTAAGVPDATSAVVLADAYPQGPYEFWPSPDGQLLATTAADDPVVRIWETSSGTVRTRLRPEGSVQAVGISPDKQRALVATTSQEGVKVELWDLRSPDPGRALDTVDGAARLVAGSDAVLLVDQGPGPALYRLWLPGRNSALIGPGTVVGVDEGDLSNSDDQVQDTGAADVLAGAHIGQVPHRFVVRRPSGRLDMVDGDTGKTVGSLPSLADDAPTVGPDGHTVFARGFGAWDVQAGRKVRDFPSFDEIHFSATNSAVVTLSSSKPDGEVDDVIRLWSRLDDDPEVEQVVPGGINDVHYDLGGKLVVATGGRPGAERVFVWDTATWLPPPGDAALSRHTFAATNLTVTEDDVLVLEAGTADRRAAVWSVRTGRADPLGGPEDPDPFIQAVSPSGRYAVLRYDGKSRLVDRRSSQVLDLAEEPGSSSGFASDDAHYVAYDEENEKVEVIGLGGGARVDLTVEDGRIFRDKVEKATLSPDRTTFATLSPGSERAQVWSMRTGRRVAELVGHSGMIYDLAYISPGKIVTSGASDGAVRIWNIPAA